MSPLLLLPKYFSLPLNLRRQSFVYKQNNAVSRFYSANKCARYYLNRNSLETIRLNHQHNLITQSTFLIHPKVFPFLPPSPKIADFATGTGIWPLQVSSLLPTAQIDGFDVSALQFPERKTWPENVKLSKRDVLHERAWEGDGKYDFVNVRALVSVLQDREWEVVVRNLVRALKPGGWLHEWWVDGDLSPKSYKCIASSPSHELPVDNPLSKGIKFYHEWSRHLNRNLATCATLPDIFAANNLGSISHTLHHIDGPRSRHEFTIVLSQGISSILFHWAADLRAEMCSIGNVGGYDVKTAPDEIEEAGREMVRFSRGGKVWGAVDLHAVAARKSS